MKISELRENLSNLEGTYIVSDIRTDVARNGSTYVRGKFSDLSGSLGFTFFDGDLGLSPALNGEVVRVSGFQTQIYNGTLQIQGSASRTSITFPKNVTDEEKAQLVEGFSENVDKMLAYMESEISRIEDADYRAVTETIWNRNKEQFQNIPAALSHHHSGIHGLLRHTNEMLYMAESVISLYRENINGSLLRSGVILHDIGKLKELECSGLGLVKRYSLAGNLAGHLVLGAEEVMRIAGELNIPEEKALLLQNLILAHHGKPEYGMAARPASLEAIVLFYLDYASSHITEYSDILKTVAPGESTPYISELNARLIRH